MALVAQLFFFALSASAASSQQSAKKTPKDEAYCGGVTDVATVERYFSDLRQAISKAGSKTRFNPFVGDEFGIRDRRGHTLYFKVRDIGSVTPGRITVQEWKEIGRRGAQSLQNAGWRGCFLDSGKVWFVGSKESGFRLTLISKDMPWVAPEKGDVIPSR